MTFALDFRLDRPSTPARDLLAAVDSESQADRTGTLELQGLSLAQTVLDLSPEHRRRELPTVCATTGRVVAGWIRLDDRSTLISELRQELRAVTPPRADEPTDPDLVLAAHLRWGRDAPRHLLGDFSYAVVDPSNDTVVAAVDPLATRPLVFTSTAHRFAASTSIPGVLAADVRNHEPSAGWLAANIAGSMSRPHETPFPAIHRLTGGELLEYRLGGQLTRHRYHRWSRATVDARRHDPRWVAAYRPLLDSSFTDRLRTDLPVGCESSGGLDSSTCVAYAARKISVDRLRTYGFVMLDEEPELIRAVHDRAGVLPEHEHLWGPDDERTTLDPDLAIRVLGQPVEHSVASSHVGIFELARAHGVRTLLSGFGGDEVVTNPAGLLHEELLDQWRLITLWKTLHGPSHQLPARFVATLVRRNRWRARQTAVHQAALLRLASLPLRPEVIDEFDLAERLAFESRYTDPYRTINASIVDERLAAGFVPARFRDCSLLAHAHGLEYTWPLWDVRMVEQYLRTPSIEKRGRHYGRLLHRRAIDGLVADEVTWRVDKGTGDPLAPGRPRPEELRIDHAALHPKLQALLDPGRLSTTERRTSNGIIRLDGWLRR